MVGTLIVPEKSEYPLKKVNRIEDPKQILENALFALNDTAMKFADDAISDAKVRESYASNIKRISVEIKRSVDAKEVSVKQASIFCHELRNKIMMEHRKYTSAYGLARAEKHKSGPKPHEFYLNKYSQEKFKLNFEDLSSKQKNIIYYETISSAGRDNKVFTTKNKRLKIIGKVAILVTASVATYEILNAENQPKEAIKQGMGIGGAMAGGWLAGLGVSTACGPGAPICSLVVVIIGSIGGSMIGSAVADSLDDEIEEFTKWNIR